MACQSASNIDFFPGKAGSLSPTPNHSTAEWITLRGTKTENKDFSRHVASVMTNYSCSLVSFFSLAAILCHLFGPNVIVAHFLLNLEYDLNVFQTKAAQKTRLYHRFWLIFPFFHLLPKPFLQFHFAFLLHLTFLCSSLLLSKANSTSTGQLDKLVSAGLPALTPESEEERSLPPQRVSTFRPRPYSMADTNKVRRFKL